MSPYDLAYKYAMHTSCSIFLTGKAGTGKTTFLRKLKAECPKQICVVAPTGVAAINAEGTTIHSLFQLPPQVFLPTDAARRLLFKEMQMREQKRRVLRNLELLVIDEISMVRADLLDTIDVVLRHVKHRSQQPFGGVQVLFIGDLYQLSPVARPEDWQLLREWYQGPYFFQARVFQEITPVYIELDHVFRQTNQDFVDLLNQVRVNQLTEEGLKALNTRYSQGKVPMKDTILLSTHNAKVDAINDKELAALKGRTYTYSAIVRNTFPESLYPMDATLVLKVGARVMFTKNDSEADKAYYNGKLGTVVELSDDKIVVECSSSDTAKPEQIVCHRETWENIRYTSQPNSDEVEPEVVGTFTHFPLRTAWAITIHKAQGLTFDSVLIDAEDAFAAGQVYVALSRCRSLQGITLTSPIPRGALTNASDVVQFTSRQPSIDWVESQLHKGELVYLRQLLCNLFDLHDLLHKIEMLRHWVQSEASSVDEAKAILGMSQWETLLMEEERTLESFRQQIVRIFAGEEVDMAFLSNRLKAAATYFQPRFQKALETIKEADVDVLEKAEEMEWKMRVTEIASDLARQNYVIQGVATQPSVQHIFSLRQQFTKELLKSQTSKTSKRRSSKANKPSSTPSQTELGAALPTAVLVLRGKTLRTVARERHLSLLTVCQHVSYCLWKGIIPDSKLRAADRKLVEQYRAQFD